MSFNQTVIDVSVYQGEIDWPRVKAAGIYAAVLRAGYGMYAHQKDARFEEYYAGARAAGLPVGAYWFSYAKTAAEARREARVCLEILAGRALQMPLYFDQEESGIPAAVRTACALAFLGYIRANSRYKAGYYTYTAYFPSVELAAIQAHCDTIWLADYRQNYDKTIPRDMHQYTSSGSVPGILGRVDMNHLYRDFPAETKEEEKTMEFQPVTGKVLRCTSAARPACETFSAPDVNAGLGALALGESCPITAQGGTVQVGGLEGVWYIVHTGGGGVSAGAGLGPGEAYCLALPDGRCVVENAPQPPAEGCAGALAAQAGQLAEVKAAAQAALDRLDKLAARQEELAGAMEKLLARQQAAGRAMTQ